MTPTTTMDCRQSTMQRPSLLRNITSAISVAFFLFSFLSLASTATEKSVDLFHAAHQGWSNPVSYHFIITHIDFTVRVLWQISADTRCQRKMVRFSRNLCMDVSVSYTNSEAPVTAKTVLIQCDDRQSQRLHFFLRYFHYVHLCSSQKKTFLLFQSSVECYTSFILRTFSTFYRLSLMLKWCVTIRIMCSRCVPHQMNADKSLTTEQWSSHNSVSSRMMLITFNTAYTQTM